MVSLALPLSLTTKGAPLPLLPPLLRLLLPLLLPALASCLHLPALALRPLPQFPSLVSALMLIPRPVLGLVPALAPALELVSVALLVLMAVQLQPLSFAVSRAPKAASLL